MTHFTDICLNGIVFNTWMINHISIKLWDAIIHATVLK